MTFFEFQDDYRTFRRLRRENRAVTIQEFYQKLRGMNLQEGFLRATWERRVAAQVDFYKWGKPYVKVFPAMATCLGQTKVDIDAKFVKAGYPTFEIRLPVEHNTYMCQGYTLQSILCHFEERYIHLYLDFGWTQNDFGLYYECEFELKPGVTISQSVVEMPYVETSHKILDLIRENNLKEMESRAATQLERHFIMSVISLVIATNFFLTSQHEIVAPNIKRKHIDVYLKAREQGNIELIEKLVESARKDGLNGFVVGREIKLPRDIVKYHKQPGHADERSWELNWAHVRSGHLRLQPVGPREENEKKLVFVMPTVIRADLPMKPRVGYRIEDPV